MNTIVEALYELQQLLLRKKTSAAAEHTRIRKLRELVPSPVLAHFDRLVAQGHRGVALVHHGVCGECHLRVSSATAASLVRPDEIFLCENCGCYLLLAPEESIAAGARAAPVKPSGRPARRKPVATAA
jgi:predicted  nucleic acid-binding Zn-ribbon protein